MAVSSSASNLEAAALVIGASASDPDVEALRKLGPNFHADPDRTVLAA
jgi:hypothetical protein